VRRGAACRRAVVLGQGPHHRLVRVGRVRWLYTFWIIARDVWPRMWASTIGFIPRVSAHVAYECRSRCGYTRFVIPAEAPSSWMTCSTPDGVSGP
jgi:hypothetical protein